MGAGWAKNEVVAAKRRCDLIIIGDDGQPASPGVDFMALGVVFISGVTMPDFALALGTMTNKRRPLVIDDDVIESVDTGADTATLTAHGYKTGDGPFDCDEALGSIVAGADFWIIRVDANTIQVASSLANAYAGTEETLTGTETGATISDNVDTERGIFGHFTYEATQAETNHDGKETTVIVDGPSYQRELLCGAYTAVTMQADAATAFDQVGEGSLTYGDLLRVVARSLVANFTKTGNDFVIRDLADSKDSHESTVTPTAKTGSNIIDPT